ncbi:MAG TPA: ATP-binding protein [Casimicrobiaceae bacterium]|nr:ATP-binding protein [Casimicrobiaceae bacterium]
MTLARRLLVVLLVAIPIIWAVAVGAAYARSRHEINELFDTQQIHVARFVLAMLPMEFNEPRWLASAQGALGAAELKDLSVAIWAEDGRRILADREGEALPFRAGASGFVDLTLSGERWHVYYLHPADSRFSVAVGQSAYERHEVLAGLLTGQLLPWALMLPVLLVAMTIAVRHVLKPVRQVAHEIEYRRADDLRPVAVNNPPAELKPLLASMNRLFARIGESIEHERRLTADAAHELRTPLAALRAQWEAARVAADDTTRADAFRQVGRGIDRLGRLVDQLLALAAIESRSATAFTHLVRWESVIEQALSDCMPLIEQTGTDVEVKWPSTGRALPMLGDEALLTLMIRNLVDNALRYAPPGSNVAVRLGADELVVEDCGPGLDAEMRERLGDRFHRPPGQAQPGSGLGISIVMRVAALHDLDVAFTDRAQEEPAQRGLRVTLRRAR